MLVILTREEEIGGYFCHISILNGFLKFIFGTELKMKHKYIFKMEHNGKWKRHVRKKLLLIFPQKKDSIHTSLDKIHSIIISKTQPP